MILSTEGFAKVQALAQKLEGKGNRLISLAEDIRIQLSGARPADKTAL